MSSIKIAFSKFNLRDSFGAWWENATKKQRIAFRVLLIGFFYALPFLDNPILGTPETNFQSVLFYPLAVYVAMAVGLNIVVGKSGILDLGYVAFFAIGAYTHAILGTFYGVSLWFNIILGAAFAMIAGVILGLPALRLRGDYLAIITLGFGEIVRIVALNLEITGGAAGIAGIPAPPNIFNVTFDVLDGGVFLKDQ